MPNPGPHSSIGILGGHAAAAAKAKASGFGWRGPQVCAITGVTYRQLDYWARTDLLEPSITQAHGSGTVRRYSYRDLIELAIIRRLLDAGISLQAVRRALTHLKDRPAEDLAAANLVLAGTDTILATTGDQITQLLRDGHGVLNIVPLAGVAHDVDAAIGRLETPGTRSA